LLTSTSGVAASTFADTAQGAQARISLQNGQGGVDGRKLNLVTDDDQSGVSSNLSAAQDLVQNKSAFGVLAVSAFMFGSYRYLQQRRVPVTGGAFDGPEWGQQPNTNMFTFSPIDPKYPYPYGPNTAVGKFFKSIGATNVAEFASNTPSSRAAAEGTKASVLAAGLKNGYENLSVPFGGVDFTGYVLALKQAGIDGAECVCVESSDLALATTARNAGLSLKSILATGYDQQTLDDKSAVAAAQGQYFQAFTVPFELHTAPTTQMLAAMKHYAHYQGSIPDYGQVQGWLSADLMIKGLQTAGPNPTRSSFMTGLREVTNFDGGGVLPSPVDLSLSSFGKLPATSCFYYLQLQGAKFVPLPKVCGSPLTP
jgi:branched-chain amino acid transport system substrate-binding protein